MPLIFSINVQNVLICCKQENTTRHTITNVEKSFINLIAINEDPTASFERVLQTNTVIKEDFLAHQSKFKSDIMMRE